MALLFADGWEDMTAGSTPPGAPHWASSGAGTAAATFARFATSPMHWSHPSAAGTLTHTLSTPSATLIVGFAFRVATYPAATATLCSFRSDAAATAHMLLRITTTGALEATRSASTVLGTSAAGVVPVGSWVYVEMKTTLSDTVGAVEVRVGGTTVIGPLTSQDTKNAGTLTTFDSIRLTGDTAIFYFDDLYICNDSGGVNDTFLGDLVVESLRLTGTSENDFVGSDGNSTDNHLLVDEPGDIAAADYVGSATIGARDLYTTGASARPAASLVHTVMVVAGLQASDAGARSATITTQEGGGGAVRQSSNKVLTASNIQHWYIQDRKNDGTPYDVTAANALLVGVDVSA